MKIQDIVDRNITKKFFPIDGGGIVMQFDMLDGRLIDNNGKNVGVTSKLLKAQVEVICDHSLDKVTLQSSSRFDARSLWLVCSDCGQEVVIEKVKTIHPPHENIPTDIPRDIRAVERPR